MKRRLIAVILAVLLVAAGVLAYAHFRKSWQGSSDIVRVSGNFEITDVALSFRLGGWVKDRPVDEGMTVQAGKTIIAQLDDTEFKQDVAQRAAELATAQALLAEQLAGSRPEEIAASKAAVDKAKAQLAELEAGSRPEEITASKATTQAAKAEADRTHLDFQRLQTLHDRGVAGSQEFDTAKSLYDIAEAKYNQSMANLDLVLKGPRKEQIEQARWALKEAQDRYTLVEKGPRQELKDQAASRVDQARAALSLAQTRLGFTTLVSPITGVVLAKHTEAGEFVAAGTPIVTVGDLQNIWLRAYVDAIDLDRIKLNQTVQVTIDSTSKKVYRGHISFISDQAEFTPKNVQTAKERVKLVYRIKITVPNDTLELKPGMPADADINVSEKR